MRFNIPTFLWKRKNKFMIFFFEMEEPNQEHLLGMSEIGEWGHLNGTKRYGTEKDLGSKLEWVMLTVPSTLLPMLEKFLRR